MNECLMRIRSVHIRHVLCVYPKIRFMPVRLYLCTSFETHRRLYRSVEDANLCYHGYCIENKWCDNSESGMFVLDIGKCDHLKGTGHKMKLQS